MSHQPPDGQVPSNIAAAITDVSERASQLVREEIELAKAEVTQKGMQIARGAAIGAVAGVFFVMALILALVGGAWLLYYYLPVGTFAYFWGFFAMAALLIVMGIGAGLIAARFLKRSTPPVPTMAIEEAQLIRETVSAPPGPPVQPAGEARAAAPVAAPPAPPVPPPGGEG